MPIYCYQCQSCGNIEEALRKIAERESPLESCDRCGKPGPTLMFNESQATAFKLNCAGFHNTDYGKHGPKSSGGKRK